MHPHKGAQEASSGSMSTIPSSVTSQATHYLQKHNNSNSLEEYTSGFWLQLQNIQRGSRRTEGAIRDSRILVEDRPLAPRPGCLIQATVTSTRQTPRLTSQLAAYIASSRALDNPVRRLASPISSHSSKKCFSRALCRRLLPPRCRATRPCFASSLVGSCLVGPLRRTSIQQASLTFMVDKGEESQTWESDFLTEDSVSPMSMWPAHTAALPGH